MSIKPIIKQDTIRRSACHCPNTKSTLQTKQLSLNLLPSKLQVNDLPRVALGDIQNTVAPRLRVKSDDLGANYYYACQTATTQATSNGIVYEKTTQVIRASTGGIQYAASSQIVKSSGCDCPGANRVVNRAISNASHSSSASSASYKSANMTVGSSVRSTSNRKSTGSSYHSCNSLQVPKTNRSRSTSEVTNVQIEDTRYEYNNATTQSSPSYFASVIGSTPFNGGRSSLGSQNSTIKHAASSTLVRNVPYDKSERSKSSQNSTCSTVKRAASSTLRSNEPSVYNAVQKTQKTILKVPETTTTSRNAMGSSFKSLIAESSIISSNSSNSSVYTNKMSTQGSKYDQSRPRSTSTLYSDFTSIESNSNVLLRENSLLRKEPKLKTKLEKKQLINMELDYSYEYLESIYYVMLKEELNIMIPSSNVNLLKRHSSARAGVLNWLLKLQRFVNFQENEFYITVRLFDMTLIKAEIPHNLFQLLALTTLWISIKINSVKPLIRLSSLLSMCNNSFTEQQLIKMEQKVLSLNKFKIPSVEPTLFVNYYLTKLQITQEKIVLYAALYILDSMSIKWYFSSLKLSTLSMAAINYALCKLNDKNANYFNGIVQSSEMDGMVGMMETIAETLSQVYDTNYVFKEPYFKYCELKMCKVSKLII